MQSLGFRRLWWLLILWLVMGVAAIAQEQADFEAVGPKKVVLGDNLATLNLPKGFAFIGAKRVKEMLPNPSGDELGAVVEEGEDFAIIIGFEDMGYVKDDDAAELDANKLLESMKEGTEEANEERRKRGLADLHVTGWFEPPHYDSQTHRMVWGIEGKSGEDPIVNYNTRLLGRKGVLYLNLITDKDELKKYQPAAAQILAATSFNDGSRYEDYKSGDKISDLGLAALVIGGAAVAKKTGLLAIFFLLFKKLGALLLVFKKFIIFIVVGVYAVIRKGFSALTGRGGQETAFSDHGLEEGAAHTDSSSDAGHHDSGGHDAGSDAGHGY